jgi:hypothetical protein
MTFLLGTAQWGWNIPAKEAFGLLDAWLKAGHRGVDIATNYPINKNAADFRAAERILGEYLAAHGLRSGLSVTIKVGSLDNMRSPEVNLAPSFLHIMTEEYGRMLGGNLHSLMLHWDNRDDDASISESFSALCAAANTVGFTPGLSGIAAPHAYAKALAAYTGDLHIQLKNNALQSDLPRYSPLLSAVPQAQVFAYGINAGGVKIEEDYGTESTFLLRGGLPEQHPERLQRLRAWLPHWNAAFVRPPVKTMNHIGLILNGLNPKVQGMVLGIRTVNQLKETLDFWRNVETFDYADVWKSLTTP